MDHPRVSIPEEERLDVLARRLYGSERGGTVEALLAANPGLAAEGPFVPAGRTVAVPRRDPAPRILPVVNPWD